MDYRSTDAASLVHGQHEQLLHCSCMHLSTPMPRRLDFSMHLVTKPLQLVQLHTVYTHNFSIYHLPPLGFRCLSLCTPNNNLLLDRLMNARWFLQTIKKSAGGKCSNEIRAKFLEKWHGEAERSSTVGIQVKQSRPRWNLRRGEWTWSD